MRFERRAWLGFICAVGASFHMASASSQQVRWEPIFRFPGTFFPAFAIAAAGTDSRGPVENQNGLGYNSFSFGIKILQAPEQSKIRLQVEVPEIGVRGDIETVAPVGGQPKFLMPRLSWSQERLTQIVQPLSAEVVFRVMVNGSVVDERRLPVRVRAITDAPLVACGDGQKNCQDYAPYLAAFVNENHPAIDNILRAALDIPAMPVKQWLGTQAGPDEAFKQVWAIWYLFQRNKVTYSSITTVGDSQEGIFSQTVRPLSLALRTQQANCIDGTALFASILRKIGIEPAIVLVPGHAFLAFYPDPRSKRMAFLETTMLNDASNPFNQRQPSRFGADLARMTGMDVNMEASWNSFVNAMSEGARKYQAAVPHLGKDQRFKVVPIQKAREMGILPLPL